MRVWQFYFMNVLVSQFASLTTDKMRARQFVSCLLKTILQGLFSLETCRAFDSENLHC